MKDSVEIPQKKKTKKLGVELPYHPAIPLLSIYPEETTIEKGTCTLMFTAAVFTIAGTWKQSSCPSSDELIKELWYIYTVEYYCVIKTHTHIYIWNLEGWY